MPKYDGDFENYIMEHKDKLIALNGGKKYLSFAKLLELLNVVGISYKVKADVPQFNDHFGPEEEDFWITLNLSYAQKKGLNSEDTNHLGSK